MYLHSRKDSLRSWESMENEAIVHLQNTMSSHVGMLIKEKQLKVERSIEHMPFAVDLEKMDFETVDINDFLKREGEFNRALHMRDWK